MESKLLLITSIDSTNKTKRMSFSLKKSLGCRETIETILLYFAQKSTIFSTKNMQMN